MRTSVCHTSKHFDTATNLSAILYMLCLFHCTELHASADSLYGGPLLLQVAA